MNKKELLAKLYDQLKGTFDHNAMAGNIAFQLQLMVATMPEEDSVDLQAVIDRIPGILNLDDFLGFWIDSMAPVLSEKEIGTLVEYFDSPLYEEVGQLLTKIEPLIQQAMVAYSEAVSYQLLGSADPVN